MFGLSDKERFQKRLSGVDNAFLIIKLAIADEYLSGGTLNPNSFEGAIFGQALNYLCLNDLDETIDKVEDKEKRERLKKNKNKIRDAAIMLLSKDDNLRTIITYLLFEYAALMCYQSGQEEFNKTYQWKQIQDIVKLSGAERADSENAEKYNMAWNEFVKSHDIHL